MAQVSEARVYSDLRVAVAKAGSRILILRMLPATQRLSVLVGYAIAYSASPIVISTIYYATMNPGEPRRGPTTWLWLIVFSVMTFAAMISVIICARIMRTAVPGLERLARTKDRQREFADWVTALYGGTSTQLVSSLAGAVVSLAALATVAVYTAGVFTIGFPEYLSAASFGFFATNGVYWAIRLPGFVSWFRRKKRLRFRSIDPVRTPALVSLGTVVDTASAFGIVALFALFTAVAATWATFRESMQTSERWWPVLLAESVVFASLAVIVFLLLRAGRSLEAIVADHVRLRLAKLSRKRDKLRKASGSVRATLRKEVEADYDRVKNLDLVHPLRRRRQALWGGFVSAVAVEIVCGVIMAIF